VDKRSAASRHRPKKKREACTPQVWPKEVVGSRYMVGARIHKNVMNNRTNDHIKLCFKTNPRCWCLTEDQLSKALREHCVNDSKLRIFETVAMLERIPITNHSIPILLHTWDLRSVTATHINANIQPEDMNSVRSSRNIYGIPYKVTWDTFLTTLLTIEIWQVPSLCSFHWPRF